MYHIGYRVTSSRRKSGFREHTTVDG